MDGKLRASALLFAVILIFGISVQKINVQSITGPFDERLFRDYTPYFPGLAALDQHEIFSPKFANVKKIVFLGASTVDSIGLDYTWHTTPAGEEPNVHSWGSIAGQLNELLHESGRSDWRAFDLARNGAKLTSMLYVYARILPLKPQIVVMGEAFNYYMWENADAAALNSQQYEYMERIYGGSSDTASIWHAYLDNLERHGWKRPSDRQSETDIPNEFVPRETTSTLDLAVRYLENLQSTVEVPAIIRPVQFAKLIDWKQPHDFPLQFQNPDPGLEYFHGFSIISKIQQRAGGKYFVYFSPQWQHHTDTVYIDALDRVFGGYLESQNIPFANYVPVEMKPMFETYDSYHQTLYGNRRIAKMILRDLVAKGLLK